MEGDSSQLQVRLRTHKAEIAVPNTTLSVPAKIDPEGLNKLVHALLKEDRRDDDVEDVKFDFVLLDDLLRGPLNDFLEAHQQVSKSEVVYDIDYFESEPAPEPGQSTGHDDWVADVAARGQLVLTACYDNTVNIVNAQDGEKLLTIPGHSAPVRSVAWISMDENSACFASSSHDQVVMLYRWDKSTNSIDCMNVCKGHERSVDSIAVDCSETLLASGSFDTTLKVWGAKLQTSASGEHTEDTDSKSKRSKDAKALTRTPIMTLAGHKEGISSVAWMDGKEELCSCSWDHTVKIWDTELGGMKSELVGTRSFFSLSYSPLSRVILTSSADRSIRLYDPRSKDGLIVRSQFTSHMGWVTSVDWCKKKEQLFVSGGHDTLVKMWDSRSCKTPLFDLKGHTDRVLAVDWGQANIVVSGGADNALKMFNSNLQ
jgi:ribosome biogenesis protein YTM1